MPNNNDRGPGVPKQLREFDRAARRLGWRLSHITGSDRLAYRHPQAARQVIVSVRSGDRRATKNNLARMRRLSQGTLA